MAQSKLDQLVLQLENYLECWKQFNYYLNLARSKQFTAEDENQFLEVKSVLAQELETILFAIDCAKPTKDEIHALLGLAPSLRSLGELNEANLRGVENQWHQIFIAWQSNLGQLKVQQQQLKPRSRSFWGRLWGRE